MTTQEIQSNQQVGQSTNTSTNIYIPPGTLSLTDPNYKGQLRLAIQGPPKTSKSTAAATFPNPIFLSYDRGLVSMIGRKILEVPFYDDTYVHGIMNSNAGFVNRKEALIRWLELHGRMLTKEQTLIFDANSGIQAAYHLWWEVTRMDADNLTDKGKIDKRREWRLKLGYYTELMLLIKELKCSVIWLFHESPDRNEDGSLSGEVRPLLSGQFQDEVASHFTDWFRSWAVLKPTDDDMRERFIAKFSSLELLKSTPPTHPTVYLWQTVSDNVAKCGTSLIDQPMYIEAHYNSFSKYRRKEANV